MSTPGMTAALHARRSEGFASPDTLGMEMLRAAGATGSVADELLQYVRNEFSNADAPLPSLPLPDEPFVAAWEEYAAESEVRGAWPTLRERLIQLRFPIAEGISRTAAYQAAVKRGELPSLGVALRLRAPDGLHLFIHATSAGRIPVVVAEDRGDFVTLVQALTDRNEPRPVPDSMGACIVGGYNNWDRIRMLRARWREAHPEGTEEEWRRRFREIVPRKELYQDRFILLSSGGYSAVPAAALGLEIEAWERISLALRLEHECAHYLTRRLFGSMRNSLHDELIADYAGIRAAIGEFRASWFLRFMGLENHPVYRPGGRLENYRGSPPLSDAAFHILQKLIVRAAMELERFDRENPRDPAEAIVALARRSLLDLLGDAERDFR